MSQLGEGWGVLGALDWQAGQSRRCRRCKAIIGRVFGCFCEYLRNQGLLRAQADVNLFVSVRSSQSHWEQGVGVHRESQ